MKQHREIIPLFYKKFKCIGDQCLSHCCRGWTINVDKKTHKKYKTAHQIEIKEITDKHLIKYPNGTGTNNYSYIAMNEEGNCPFFGHDKLCGIYKTLGPSALSHTCQTYPRSKTQLDGYTQHSLSFSCPEVVRLVLFQPDSMQYEENTVIENVKITEKRVIDQTRVVTQEHQLIQLFCSHLIMADSLFIEDNLYALAQFMVFLQSIDYQVEANCSQVESIFMSLVEKLTNGEIYQQRKQITSSARHQLKFSLLLIMLRFFTVTDRSKHYLLPAFTNTMHFFGLESESLNEDMLANWKKLDDEWQKILSSSCLAEPQVLKNYFLYRIYDEKFGLYDLKQSLRSLYYCFTDYFYIKTLLSVQSIYDIEVSMESIQLMFCHYSTVTQHSINLRQQLDELIDKLNFGDDLSCLLLLN